MMTSRQRVRRALEFARPDRAPRQLWMLPVVWREHPKAAIDAFVQRWPSDMTWTPGGNDQAFKRLTRGDQWAAGQYIDEWGCTFTNIHPGVIGEVKTPLIDDWSKLDDFRTPDELLQIDAPTANAFCRSTELFTLAACPRPFERLQFLRGSENLYMDIAEESPAFTELLRRVHNFYLKEMQVWAATEVDGLMFMDDWGSQRSLLIDPAVWRRIFKPLYAEYIQIAHAAGKKTLMHSDGHIAAIYPDLIELGLDALNSQIFCMDIPDLGRYRGKIAFWGEMDRQHILPRATVEESRAAAQLVLEHLWTPEGGFIAQFELGAGAKLENAHAVFEEWTNRTTVATD